MFGFVCNVIGDARPGGRRAPRAAKLFAMLTACSSAFAVSWSQPIHQVSRAQDGSAMSPVRRWFRWLDNRRMRNLTSRVAIRLEKEFNEEEIANTLALAIGHACYPDAVFGDRGAMDKMLRQIRAMTSTPCDSSTATQKLTDWENQEIKTQQLFEQVWGMTTQDFIVRIVESDRRKRQRAQI